jgi:hypothetical protein
MWCAAFPLYRRRFFLESSKNRRVKRRPLDRKSVATCFF